MDAVFIVALEDETPTPEESAPKIESCHNGVHEVGPKLLQNAIGKQGVEENPLM